MTKGFYAEEIWDEIETRTIHQVQKEFIKNFFSRQFETLYVVVSHNLDSEGIHVGKPVHFLKR